MDKFKPEDEDTVLDKVIFYRWIGSFCLGPIWGILGIQGLFGIALYGLIIVMLSLMIVKNHRYDKFCLKIFFRNYLIL